MKLKNINKPTSPLMNKIAVACASTSAFIAGYGVVHNMQAFVIAGGVLGVLGTIIPIFVDSEGEEV